MIPASHQLKPAPKRTEKRLRKEQYASDVKGIHSRGAEVMPAEYLTVHQEAEPERKFKILALAKQRRAIRTAKRQAELVRSR